MENVNINGLAKFIVGAAILTELIWLALGIYIFTIGYFYSPIFLFCAILNALTLMPLGLVLKNVKKASIGLWEKSVMGYFCVVNSFMLFFIANQIGLIDYNSF